MKNEYSTRDKKITDQGWAAMQQLLDREMPQKNRRRRAIGWWLTGLLLLPALMAGGWLLFGEPGHPSPPVEPVQLSAPPPDRPIADQAQPLPESPVQPAISDLEARPNLSPAERPVTTGVQRSVANPSGRPAVSPAGRSIARPDIAALPGAGSIPTEAGTTAETAAGQPPSPAISDREAPAANGTALLSLGFLPVAPGAVVWNRPAEMPPPISPAVFAAVPSEIKVKPAAPVWRAGATAGVVMDATGRADGFTAGIALDWQPLSHWGMQTGLAYRLNRPAVGSRPLVDVADVDFVSATNDFEIILDTFTGLNPANADPAGSDHYVTVPVQRLHRLEIPLLAFWQPIKNLRIYGGLNISHLMATKSANRYLASGQQVLIQDIEKDNREVGQLATSKLPRWQWDSQLGAGLRLGRRWEFDLFYRQAWRGSTSAESLESRYSMHTAGSLEEVSKKSRPAPLFTLAGTYFF